MSIKWNLLETNEVRCKRFSKYIIEVEMHRVYGEWTLMVMLLGKWCGYDQFVIYPFFMGKVVSFCYLVCFNILK